MDENRRPKSVIHSLGEEIIRIIAPVSICMFLVVILVSVLNSSSSNPTLSSVATIAYSENSSDSTWDKLKGAILNAVVFVVVVTIVTFLLVLLFYLRCTKFLKIYMGFSACVVLGFMGGEMGLVLIEKFNVPMDCVTFGILVLNFTVVGALAVFMSKMAILITQAYLVVIGMLVAYWFTMLPEWTTWGLLIAMSLYDLAAVLLPVGPLRLLVEMAISRDEDIPALVYEARPVVSEVDGGMVRRRVWRGNGQSNGTFGENPSAANLNRTTEDNFSPSGGAMESGLVNGEAREMMITNVELSAPLIERRINIQSDGRERLEALPNDDLGLEGIGLGSSGAIKLGLGDFIFYSVLVGRAAMYDFMTVYACYLAIIAGLGITLLLLAVYQKALPALPVSVLLVMDTSHGNEAATTPDPRRAFEFDDRTPSTNKSVSLASVSSSSSSHSSDEHLNPFCDKVDDASVAIASTSGNSAPNHFNPFRDDTDLPTSTFPTTSSFSSVPDSARKMEVPVTQSPTVQIMERPGEDVSPYRIPDYVFQRNKSRAPKEWSTASNESLFSIQMGHASFTGDLFMYNKSGEFGMRKSEELSMHCKSGEHPTRKSNKSSDFGTYSSSGELGYSKSVDLGWYNLSGELATPTQTKSESRQIIKSCSSPQPQENAPNIAGGNNPHSSNPGVGTADVVSAGNAQNHNLIESPSLAFGLNSPSAASCLDDRSSSTKSFTFPVLTKPEKSPSSLKPSSVQPNIQQQQQQQHPPAPEPQTPTAVNTTTSTMTNSTQVQARSSFSCFSCCP